MLEYLFFHVSVLEEFQAWLKEKGIAFEMEREPIQDAYLVQLEEPEDDELWDEIDARFDELSEKDQLLMEQGSAEEGDRSTAGIYIQLRGDRQTIAKVDPDILNRILTVVSMDELNRFIDSVVSSVENPDDSAICQTH